MPKRSRNALQCKALASEALASAWDLLGNSEKANAERAGTPAPLLEKHSQLWDESLVAPDDTMMTEDHAPLTLGETMALRKAVLQSSEEDGPDGADLYRGLVCLVKQRRNGHYPPDWNAKILSWQGPNWALSFPEPFRPLDKGQ